MHTRNVEKDFVPTVSLAKQGYLSSRKHSSEIILQSVLVCFMCVTVILCIVITALADLCPVASMPSTSLEVSLPPGGIMILVTRVKFHQKQSECPEAACPESWIGFQRKCFYFSDDTKNWTFSQRFCVSQGADLVQVETLQELHFLLRYKGPSDHWIGLSREQGQTWKWINGTEWTEFFPIRGGGEHAYLNDKGASSARRYTERKWICSKLDTHAQMRRRSPK